MLLDDILFNLKTYSNEIACKHDREYTYKEFYKIVCKIYKLIKEAPKERPIVVYGHKEVYMVASFLACSFLGIAYVPIDKLMGKERIKQIIELTNPSYIIGNFESDADVELEQITFDQIEKESDHIDIEQINMKPEDTYYILFTSGTTGIPKGVMVSYENLDSCVSWLKEVTSLKNHRDNYTIYNQAVFSFDLSVADTYLSLATGSNHYIGNEISVFDFNSKIEDFKNSDANMMILTPSCAELFCTDSKFNQSVLPNLEQIIFCGERLTTNLANELYSRFPHIRIINMYGPTECTYAVTSIEVPKEFHDEISIGYPKDDVKIYIVDSFGEKQEGEVGEILIAGKSVSKGYLNDPNSDKFINYKGERGFLTGDIGYLKDNKLYYISRKDSQIKYKGYRIELLDIENNILKIDDVENCKVKAEKDDDGNTKRIIALIVLKDKSKEEMIKKRIQNELPQYMIPIFKFVDTIPLTLNGKMGI